ncbi:unnamed protein product, partial [marine sediment metagenome]
AEPPRLFEAGMDAGRVSKFSILIYLCDISGSCETGR